MYNEYLLCHNPNEQTYKGSKINNCTKITKGGEKKEAGEFLSCVLFFLFLSIKQ